MRRQSIGALVFSVCVLIGGPATVACAASAWEAKDLNPVKLKPAPQHPAIVLVKNGKPAASIVVMKNAAGAGALRSYIKAATGAELPVVNGKIDGPAIVLGDCPEAAAIGLVGSKLPLEGFAIKTAPNRIHIVGNSGGRGAHGVQWGVYDFLERYVGMRWYFPPATENGPNIGQSIPQTANLIVPPVWFEDAPAFRMRVLWPPMSSPWNGSGIKLTPLHTFLRAGNSWPVQIRVHQPTWQGDADLKKNHPEVFQLRKDGTRQYEVLCYGDPQTVETYLQGIQNYIDGKKPLYAPINGKSITVSPADVELSCYCEHCRKLWDDKGGQHGGASKVMATFVNNLASEVKRRWPKEAFTIIYLPYLNYTSAPDGYKFPGNVEVQLAGMPGLASYKEPEIRQHEQENIDKWLKITGRKIQHWHYCAWPAHKTKAAYEYPHVVKTFYQQNRDKTVGTFINGVGNHWPRQHISLYCWLKVLWNPDFDVDAAVDTFCNRMFGPAAGTMRELVGIQIDGWEKSRWPGGRFSPKGIYEASFPENTVAKIHALMAKARQQAKSDALVTARLDYYEPALKEFYSESEVMAGRGFQPLHAQKVGKDPVIDGKLDDPEWKRARPNSFVQATGGSKGKPARYATSVQAVWSLDGVTFGFRLSEPTPQLLETVNGGHDNGNMWWDDNVEIFLDVTGKSEGEFYQFIVNPNGNYWDSKLKDTTYECKGFKSKSIRGKDFWSMEVYVPFASFPDALKPGSGTNTIWTGNFTRHRVADNGLKSKKPKQPGSAREYQRMNTTGSTTSDNLADFAEIRFIE